MPVIHFQHMMAKNMHNYSEREESGILRKYWNKAVLQLSGTNSKSCNSLSDVKGLWCPSSMAACNIPLSLGMTVLLCSLWLLSLAGVHTSGILESPTKSRLHLHSFTQWSLRVSSNGLHSPAILNGLLEWGKSLHRCLTTWLTSAVFHNYRWRFHNLFTNVSFMTLRPELNGKHC